MIQRYLGNKNSIADYIISEIDRFCVPGDIVCDIFSGTVSMSMALKNMVIVSFLMTLATFRIILQISI